MASYPFRANGQRMPCQSLLRIQYVIVVTRVALHSADPLPAYVALAVYMVLQSGHFRRTH